MLQNNLFYKLSPEWRNLTTRKLSHSPQNAINFRPELFIGQTPGDRIGLHQSSPFCFRSQEGDLIFFLFAKNVRTGKKNFFELFFSS